ncbi:MAG: RNA 2',3'-cyclic phosphodiesterase [archaeon]
MRCFISINLPDTIKEEAARIQSLISLAGLNIVKKDNLHLTLAFLGEISEEMKEKCISSLKEIKYSPLKASLGNFGFFPSEREVRVIWISLEPKENFKELNTLIKNQLKKNFSIDNRFESHITLFRATSFKKYSDFFDEFKKIEIIKKEFEVNYFSLMKSALTKKGPIYEEISRFSLI